MSPKFKYGDKVKIISYDGKIVSIRKDGNGEYVYKIRFDNLNLIPPEMDFSEQELIRNGCNPSGHESECPICHTKWKIVKFNMQTWKDCVKCNKTSEKIIEEYEKMKKNNTHSTIDEDEMYRYLDTNSAIWLDDDDDF